MQFNETWVDVVVVYSEVLQAFSFLIGIKRILIINAVRIACSRSTFEVRHSFGLLSRRKELRKPFTTCTEVSGPLARFELGSYGIQGRRVTTEFHYFSDGERSDHEV
jgi:hypothetical protein